MKKSLLIFFAVFCMGATAYANDEIISTQDQIPINMKKNTLQTGNERSISQFLNAYIIPNLDIICVDFYGIGDGEAYIINKNGIIVDVCLITSDMNSIELSAPDVDGQYYLVVCCSEYYGEGIFTVK